MDFIFENRINSQPSVILPYFMIGPAVSGNEMNRSLSLSGLFYVMQIKSGRSLQLMLHIVSLVKALALIRFNFTSKGSYWCLHGCVMVGTSHAKSSQ